MTAEKGKPVTKCNKVEKPAPTARECPCVITWRGNPTTTTTTTTHAKWLLDEDIKGKTQRY